jgi:hypothetical protein
LSELKYNKMDIKRYLIQKSRFNVLSLMRKYLSASLLVFLVLLFACDKDDKEKFDPVDLRYNPQDEYFLTAASPEPISFEVKSTKPWEVFGTQDWTNISPSNGKADEIEVVTITVDDNTDLDDRIDTITIKSDYWVGKRFPVFQKGIAYLTLDATDASTFPKDGDTKQFKIASNQDWSCQITKGEEWLSIVDGATGSQNGDVSLKTIPNKGEIRMGRVTVFDRHDEVVDSVIVKQEGVLIKPELDVLKVFYQGGEIKLNVESNTNWTATMPENTKWVTLTSGSSYSGDGTLVFDVDEHPGSVLREIEVVLETEGEPGAPESKIQKVVKLKQAPEMKTVRHEFTSMGVQWQHNAGDPVFENSDAIFNVSKDNPQERCRVVHPGAELGTYSFRLKDIRLTPGDKSEVYLNFVYGAGKEVRYLIASNGRTNISVQSNPANYPQESLACDLNEAHTLTLKFKDVDGNMYVEWLLDGVSFYTHTENSSDEGTIKPSDVADIFLGFVNSEWSIGDQNPTTDNGCTFDWWEFTPAIDWGE